MDRRGTSVMRCEGTPSAEGACDLRPYANQADSVFTVTEVRFRIEGWLSLGTIEGGAFMKEDFRRQGR